MVNVSVENTPQSPPRTDDLVTELRNSIVTGRFVPGQRLVEADLAEEFGASRGSVRGALAELSVEGLVERVQNRGARVRAVTMEEAVEITEVRAALEALCARKAAERIEEQDISHLREIGRDMARAVDGGDREAYAAANKRLHALIIEVSGQKTAADTVQRLRGQAVRYQFRLANQQGRPQVSLPQHLAIIEAVCAHDPDSAAAAMQAHLTSVGTAIREIGENL
ncbi:MAG TPA: GntR family transcriptional regulator [Candidatus Corynebacterium avicola]|uniref:GntR family transcriptional regulator n=1 Tax=Candidatus Corynebacterium avicola TaxID=2838527 RepID=A0A9D1UME0_9CORY|nr:GntR family transcriptional regulator [Candidatus Corynebacterium avicola]